MNNAYDSNAADAAEELRKAEKRKRMEARHNEDNTHMVNAAMGFSILAAIMWVVPIFVGVWYSKQFFGAAVTKANFYVSLSTFEGEVECNPNTGNENKHACKALNAFTEKTSLADFRDKNCRVKSSSKACELARGLYMGTWIPMLALPIAAACQILASVALAIYWNMSHGAKMKSIASNFANLALVIGTVGVVAWMIITPNFKDLPYEWCNPPFVADKDKCRILSQSSIFGLAENQIIPFGNGCMGAVGALVVSFLAAGGFICVPAHHLDESVYHIESGHGAVGGERAWPPSQEYAAQPMPPNYGAIPVMQGGPMAPGFNAAPMQGGHMPPGIQQPGMPMAMI